MAQQYFRSFNPVWDFRDLTGLPLDDTYYAFFLKNTIPYEPQAVYHTPSDTPWSNPIELTAAGTLPVDVYFDRDLTYRIEIRAGDTQADALIWLIENYTPDGSGGSDGGISLSSDNQATNAQFSIVNFVSSIVLTSATDPDPVNVAPGWDLVLTGTGSATITREALNDTNANPTNAPYALRLVLTGWTTAYLRQRFLQAGMLWAGKFVSTSVTAKVEGANANISATLFDSDGTQLAIVLPSTTVIDSQYAEKRGVTSAKLTYPPTNPDTPPDAYIEYRLNLPGTVDISITSIQVVGSSSSVAFAYEQDTIERQIDNTFHYYKPQLEYKPIPSLLTGWDFPLNPAQFPAVNITTTNAYIWDQTIGGSIVGTVVVGRNSATNGLKLTNGSALEGYYILQYLSGAQAKEMLGTKLSVNVSAFRGQAGGAVTCKVYLYSGRSAAAFPTLGTTIGTVNAAGTFTLTAANWSVIPRGGLDQAQGSLSTVDTGDYTTLNDVVDLQFSGWEITDATEIADTDKFAIVVTFSAPTISTIVTVNSVSLVKGDIPTRPGAQTLDQVLRECQYYWCKSFPVGTAPAQNAGSAGASFGPQSVGASTADIGPSVRFPVELRAAPTVVIYNPLAANAQVRNITNSLDWSSSAISNISVSGFVITGVTPGGTTAGELSAVQWSADARLGKV